MKTLPFGRHRAAPAALLLAVPLALAVAAPADAQQNRQIQPGQTVSDQFTRATPVLDDGSHYHLWSFQARAGTRYRITLRSTDFDAYLALGDATRPADTDPIATDDDGGGGTDARIVYTAPTSGTLVVRANTLDGGQTGRYTLQLEEIGPAPVARPRPIEPGRTVSAELTDGDPELDDGSFFHLYSFRARRGERYRITHRSRDFDAFLAIGTLRRNGDFVELDENDDGEDMGTDAEILFTVPSNGTYVIRATTLFGGSTGRYQLRLERQ